MARRLHFALLSLLLLALPATKVFCEACVGGDCSMAEHAAASPDLPSCHAAMAQESLAGPSLAADGACCQVMSASKATATAIPAPPTLDPSDFGRVTGLGAVLAPVVYFAGEQGEKYRPPRLQPPLYTLHSSLLI